MSERGTIRVLAVDDHPVFRQGIAGLIEGQPDMTLVGEASNGREAIQQFRAHRPDVTLMDLQMSELQNLVQAEATARGITLDLGEITLADRETVRFLAACKTRGITLKNCPSYIREWIRLAGG
jgi:DNA-binding NarL/FixJ family response regulator